jgi:hypothetical protein
LSLTLKSRINDAELASEALAECTELDRQIQLWNMEAVHLAQSMKAFEVALRADPSRINFRGDLIILDAHSKSSELELAIVDLARIRDLVCNLRILQAQRQKLQAAQKHVDR